VSAVLDAGALIAIERDDRRTLALLAGFQRAKVGLKTPAGVTAQVWRHGGRQAKLARFLHAVDEIDFTPEAARTVGSLLGASQTTDVIDASVVALAAPGDVVVTSDPDDLLNLIKALGIRVKVVRC
jgi:hypothetical protein